MLNVLQMKGTVKLYFDTTHSLFLSITRLTRMALCSEYSLHTPVQDSSKQNFRLEEHYFSLENTIIHF